MSQIEYRITDRQSIGGVNDYAGTRTSSSTIRPYRLPYQSPSPPEEGRNKKIPVKQFLFAISLVSVTPRRLIHFPSAAHLSKHDLRKAVSSRKNRRIN